MESRLISIDEANQMLPLLRHIVKDITRNWELIIYKRTELECLEKGVDSVKKTNRLVVIDESWPFAGVSAEIAYEIQKYAFDYLDAPVTRVNSADTSLHYSPPYIDEYLPNPEKVIKAVKEVMYINS